MSEPAPATPSPDPPSRVQELEKENRHLRNTLAMMVAVTIAAIVFGVAALAAAMLK